MPNTKLNLYRSRLHKTSDIPALPGTGQSRSPLEAHRQWLLDLVATEPDLTLKEIRARLKSVKRLKTGTTSVWRFYERHDICTPPAKIGLMSLPRHARRHCLPRSSAR